MNIVSDTLNDFKTFSVRKFLNQTLFLFLTIGSALIVWNTGKLVTNTESPIVVVLTGSMEPAFQRGDLLLITHFKEELVVGDIIAYKVSNHAIPIVHRAMIIQVDNKNKEKYYLLSKGDANPVDDRGLYPDNRMWLKESEIIGKIRAYCPYLGYITILLNEHPTLKYIVIGIMVLSSLTSKGDSS